MGLPWPMNSTGWMGWAALCCGVLFVWVLVLVSCMAQIVQAVRLPCLCAVIIPASALCFAPQPWRAAAHCYPLNKLEKDVYRNHYRPRAG
jgi:hypothetical protein